MAAGSEGKRSGQWLFESDADMPQWASGEVVLGSPVERGVEGGEPEGGLAEGEVFEGVERESGLPEGLEEEFLGFGRGMVVVAGQGDGCDGGPVVAWEYVEAVVGIAGVGRGEEGAGAVVGADEGCVAEAGLGPAGAGAVAAEGFGDEGLTDHSIGVGRADGGKRQVGEARGRGVAMVDVAGHVDFGTAFERAGVAFCPLAGLVAEHGGHEHDVGLAKGSRKALAVPQLEQVKPCVATVGESAGGRG